MCFNMYVYNRMTVSSDYIVQLYKVKEKLKSSFEIKICFFFSISSYKNIFKVELVVH